MVMRFGRVAVAALAIMAGAGEGRAADLASPAVVATPAVPAELQPATPFTGWTFTMTPYGWLTWIDGDVSIRGRDLNLDVTPRQLIDNLQGIWMSYQEARNGPLAVFSDIIYVSLGSSKSGFITRQPRPNVTASLGATVGANADFWIVEFGGAYEVYRAGAAAAPGGATALEVLAGGRYWDQQADVKVKLKGTVKIDDLVHVTKTTGILRSGDVSWVDPFIGLRGTWEFMPGQRIQLRGDIGGFDVGSQFSWQAMATYSANLYNAGGFNLDGYLGFRALSVDYTEGSGTKKYKYDAVQYGPMVGLTARF